MGGMWGMGVAGVGGGGELKRFYVATTHALSSAVVYTKHEFSPREGFLIHQRYIFENLKSYKYRDETTRKTRQQYITEMLKQKKTKVVFGDSTRNIPIQIRKSTISKPKSSRLS